MAALDLSHERSRAACLAAIIRPDRQVGQEAIGVNKGRKVWRGGGRTCHALEILLHKGMSVVVIEGGGIAVQWFSFPFAPWCPLPNVYQMGSGRSPLTALTQHFMPEMDSEVISCAEMWLTFIRNPCSQRSAFQAFLWPTWTHTKKTTVPNKPLFRHSFIRQGLTGLWSFLKSDKETTRPWLISTWYLLGAPEGQP